MTKEASRSVRFERGMPKFTRSGLKTFRFCKIWMKKTPSSMARGCHQQRRETIIKFQQDHLSIERRKKKSSKIRKKSNSTIIDYQKRPMRLIKRDQSNSCKKSLKKKKGK